MTKEKNPEKYGFTGKITLHQAGAYLNIPRRTVESASLQDKQLLHLELRNQDGQVLETTRKTTVTSGKAKVYLTKNTKQKLGVEDKELVDVFFHKD